MKKNIVQSRKEYNQPNGFDSSRKSFVHFCKFFSSFCYPSFRCGYFPQNLLPFYTTMNFPLSQEKGVNANTREHTQENDKKLCFHLALKSKKKALSSDDFLFWSSFSDIIEESCCEAGRWWKSHYICSMCPLMCFDEYNDSDVFPVSCQIQKVFFFVSCES